VSSERASHAHRSVDAIVADRDDVCDVAGTMLYRRRERPLLERGRARIPGAAHRSVDAIVADRDDVCDVAGTTLHRRRERALLERGRARVDGARAMTSLSLAMSATKCWRRVMSSTSGSIGRASSERARSSTPAPPTGTTRATSPAPRCTDDANAAAHASREPRTAPSTTSTTSSPASRCTDDAGVALHRVADRFDVLQLDRAAAHASREIAP
jgi:hypothetical protein